MGQAEDSAITAPMAAARPTWRRLRPPTRHTTPAIAAFLLVATSALVVWINFRLAWLRFANPQPGTSGLAYYDDLRNPNAVAYEQALLILPWVAAAAISALAVLIIIRCIGNERFDEAERKFRLPALWLLGTAGFTIALTGTRWLGFYLARRADTGPALLHLHVVPYVNLAFGLLILVLAASVVVHDLRATVWPSRVHRWALLAAATSAFALLTLPLIPFAHIPYPGGVHFHMDEYTLVVMGARKDAWDLTASRTLALARILLWVGFAASSAAAIASHARATGIIPQHWAWVQHLMIANGALAVAGAILTARFIERLLALRDGTTLEWNPVLPLAFLTLGALTVLYARAARAQA